MYCPACVCSLGPLKRSNWDLLKGSIWGTEECEQMKTSEDDEMTVISQRDLENYDVEDAWK